MGIPIPDTGSVTEDTDVVDGLLSVSGDIDYLVGDDTGEWTVITNDTSLGFGSSFSMDADGNWTFSVDNDDPGIQALDTGETLDFQYIVSSVGGDSTVTITVFGADEPPCFAKGTLIDTPSGQRPIESLRAGDQVITSDAGPVSIRWIGSRRCSQSDPILHASIAPIEISPNSFGPGVPTRTLKVSPLHRILLKGPEAQLLFGEREVLCAAQFLVNGASILQSSATDVEYFHILLDQHHVIRADGCESETLYPGKQGLAGFGDKEREQIFSMFPNLRASPEAYGSAARLVLKAYETRLLSVPENTIAA